MKAVTTSDRSQQMNAMLEAFRLRTKVIQLLIMSQQESETKLALSKTYEVLAFKLKLPEDVVRRIETAVVSDQANHKALHKEILDLLAVIVDSPSYVKLQPKTIECLSKDLSNSSLSSEVRKTASSILSKLVIKGENLSANKVVADNLKQVTISTDAPMLSAQALQILSDLDQRFQPIKNNNDPDQKSVSILLDEIEHDNADNPQILKLAAKDGMLTSVLQATDLAYAGNSKLMPHVAETINLWNEKNVINFAECLKYRTDLAKSDSFLPEMLAVVNRAVFLRTGYELRPVQKMSVLTLCAARGKGRLLQIATGECKSTTTAVIAAIKALRGEKVDIVTSSKVLATRDAEYWGSFFSMLGITSSNNIIYDLSLDGIKECYKASVVYGDAIHFQGDLLRDEYKNFGTRAGRKFSESCVLIDEVDSMLIDESGKVAKLAGPIPAMEYLAPIFVVTWNYAVAVLTHFKSDEFSDVPVDRIAELMHTNITEYIKRISDPDDHGQALERLVLPKHLQDFVASQAERWAKSAIRAASMIEKKDYLVIPNEKGIDIIAPVDYDNTGVVQDKTNWQDGLQQFLQVRHKLKMTPDSVTTSFISNMAYFKRYGNNIFGMTGTLGSVSEKGLLSEVYGIDFALLPTFKQSKFQELPAMLLPSQAEWQEAVIASSRSIAESGRAVLIIFKTIIDAEKAHKALLDSGYNEGKLRLYTRSNEKDATRIIEDVVKPGDIIVATNLAGRGTDIKTSKEVEAAGGLHVCLTFLPGNIRVEKQALGRTARQGNNGTGQLVLDEFSERRMLINYGAAQDVVAKAQTIDGFRKLRDVGEATRLQLIKDTRLEKIEAEDTLFGRFNELTQALRKSHAHTDYKLSQLEELWGLWLNKLNYARRSDITQEMLLQEFETFKAKVTKDYAQGYNLIQNPSYLTYHGNNKLGDNGSYDASIFLYKAAIELDPIYSFAAHYNVAYAYLRKNPNHKNIQEYIDASTKHLHEALNSIEGIIIPQLHMMQILMGQEANESPLSGQIATKIDLLKMQSSYIQKALELIGKNVNTGKIIYIKDSETKPIFELVGASGMGTIEESKKVEVLELAKFGVVQLFTLDAKNPPRSWLSAIGVTFLGVAQIVVGAMVTIAGGGKLGVSMMMEGAQDIYHGVRAMAGKEHIDWDKYWSNKAISYAITFLTMGADEFKKNLDALKVSMQQVVTSTTQFFKNTAANLMGNQVTSEIAKSGFTALAKKFVKEKGVQAVMLEIGKTVAFEQLTTIAVKEIVGGMDGVKDDIASRAHSRILATLNSEPTSSRLNHLIMLDKASNSNSYQDQIRYTSQSLLAKRKVDIEGIAQAVAGAAMKGVASSSSFKVKFAVGALTTSVGVVKGMNDIDGILEDFCNELVAVIEKLDKNATTKSAEFVKKRLEVLEGNKVILGEKFNHTNKYEILEILQRHGIINKETGAIDDELIQPLPGFIPGYEIMQPMTQVPPKEAPTLIDQIYGKEPAEVPGWKIRQFQMKELWRTTDQYKRQNIEQVDFGPYRHLRGEIIAAVRASVQATKLDYSHQKQQLAAELADGITGKSMSIVQNAFLRPVINPIMGFVAEPLVTHFHRLLEVPSIHHLPLPISSGDNIDDPEQHKDLLEEFRDKYFPNRHKYFPKKIKEIEWKKDGTGGERIEQYRVQPRPFVVLKMNSSQGASNSTALVLSDNVAKRFVRNTDEVIAQGSAIVHRFGQAYPITYKVIGSGVIVAGGAAEGVAGAFFPFIYGASRVIDFTCRESFDAFVDRNLVNPALQYFGDIKPGDPEYGTARTMFKGGLTLALGTAYAKTTLKWQQKMLPPVQPVRARVDSIQYKSVPTQVTWVSPSGTQQTYKIYQRADVNWDQVRINSYGDKRFIGKTNREAALAGKAPELPDSNIISLHHIGQDSRGPLVEVSSSTHSKGSKILHQQFGVGQKHPEFPVDHGSKWQKDVSEYWKWRVKNAK